MDTTSKSRPGLASAIEISYATNLDVVALPIIVSYHYSVATWDFEALRH